MPMVDEEQGVGVSVASFMATDQDQQNTENSRLTFTIAGITATTASGASIDPVRPNIWLYMVFSILS